MHSTSTYTNCQGTPNYKDISDGAIQVIAMVGCLLVAVTGDYGYALGRKNLHAFNLKPNLIIYIYPQLNKQELIMYEFHYKAWIYLASNWTFKGFFGASVTPNLSCKGICSRSGGIKEKQHKAKASVLSNVLAHRHALCPCSYMYRQIKLGRAAEVWLSYMLCC